MVFGHGPRANDLTEQVVKHLQRWGDDYWETQPTIRLARGRNRRALAGQFVIDKASVRLAISW